MSYVDPVGEPNAYQQMLLGLLGDDDPAEVQRETPDAWRQLIQAAGDRLRIKPAEGEWSMVELLGHAADAELVVGSRLRWILAHDRPPLLPYDQDLWVSALGHQDGDPDELLTEFSAMRRANLALWNRATPEQRKRVGMHEERGPESFELTFRLLAGHDRFHLDQARKTLEAVRSG